MTESITFTPAAISPQRGDVIVIRADTRLPMDAVETIRGQAKLAFPDHRVVVLDGGLDLEAVPVERLRALLGTGIA